MIVFAYAIFLVLAWKETPAALKRMALYLISVLLISNLFSGWLYENRNYMPAVFVLAVITARYISRRMAVCGKGRSAMRSDCLFSSFLYCR
jgi:hypothetical protein